MKIGVKMIEEILKLTPAPNRTMLLERATRLAPEDGHILEFGVFKGDSIRLLAGLAKGRPVTGFDSFQGLPEDWKRSEKSTYKKGHFDLGGQLPAVPENVKLVKGFFSSSLGQWMGAQTLHTISLLHIDCDLYGGAKYVLSKLNKWILPGTIIVFDELVNLHDGVYKTWEMGEWKALHEWMEETGRSVTPILRTTTHQVAVKVE